MAASNCDPQPTTVWRVQAGGHLKSNEDCMLTKIKGDYVLECDGCGAVLETECNDFDEAREVMQAWNWKARKQQGEWLHWCPDCYMVLAGQ